VEIPHLVGGHFPQDLTGPSAHFLEDPVEIPYLMGGPAPQNPTEVSVHFLEDPVAVSHLVGDHFLPRALSRFLIQEIIIF
jgi:hypothetical protein